MAPPCLAGSRIWAPTITAYNRYPLVICTLGLLLGGLHSLFQLHQTPADTWTAAYLTAREGTELMLTENSTDPQVLRSLLHLLIGVPLLGGLFSRGYAVKGIFAATRRGRYLRFYRAEMGRLLAVTLLYNLLYCGAQALCATVAVHALPAAAAVRLIGISLFSDTLVLFGFAVLCAGLCVTRGEKAGVLLGAAAFLLAVMALFLLPVPLRQYNPVLWCLCSAFPTDETLFAYPLWGYYAAGSAILAAWVLLWGRVLKTKDIL